MRWGGTGRAEITNQMPKPFAISLTLDREPDLLARIRRDAGEHN
jgi:hypothetical protein